VKKKHNKLFLMTGQTCMF